MSSRGRSSSVHYFDMLVLHMHAGNAECARPATKVATVTSKGQITIPAAFRRMLGVRPGDRVGLSYEEGALRVTRTTSSITANFGAVEPLNRPEDWRQIRKEFEEGVAEEVAESMIREAGSK